MSISVVVLDVSAAVQIYTVRSLSSQKSKMLSCSSFRGSHTGAASREIILLKVLDIMQAETSFKLVVRSYLPLTQTLASQQASLPRPFSRAVFLFDYADSDLLHSLEDTFKALNARCLGLHISPGAIAATAKPASVAGSYLLGSGMFMYCWLHCGGIYVVHRRLKVRADWYANKISAAHGVSDNA